MAKSGKGSGSKGGGSGGSAASTDGGPDSSEAKALEAEYSAWAASLTQKEINAIEAYQDSGYMDMNAYARFGGKDNPELNRIMNNLDNSLLKSAAPKDMTVYRTMDEGANSFISTLSVGKTYTDKGYVSTTTNNKLDFQKEIGGSATEMVIKVPKGTPAAYLNSLGKRGANLDRGEQEVLIMRGMQYTVTKIVRTKDGRVRVHVSVVDD